MKGIYIYMDLETGDIQAFLLKNQKRKVKAKGLKWKKMK